MDTDVHEPEPLSNALLEMESLCQRATGKTIAAVSLRNDWPSDELVHRGEALQIDFADGSQLILKTGSNAATLFGNDHPTHTPSDVSVSFAPIFRERAEE